MHGGGYRRPAGGLVGAEGFAARGLRRLERHADLGPYGAVGVIEAGGAGPVQLLRMGHALAPGEAHGGDSALGAQPAAYRARLATMVGAGERGAASPALAIVLHLDDQMMRAMVAAVRRRGAGGDERQA